MTRYAFVGAGPDGRLVRSIVAAETEAAATADIEARGLVVVRIRPSRRPVLPHRGPSRRALAAALGNIAGLVAAGVPVDSALRTTGSLVKGPLERSLGEARRHLAAGAPVSDALERSRVGLPTAALGLLLAAEAGSQLEYGLREAAALLDREAEIGARVTQALAYPFLLLVTGSAALALIMGTVVPRFAALLTDLGQATPASTRLLLAGASLVRDHGIALAMIIGASATGLVAWLRTDRGLFAADRVSLRAPIIGPIVHLLASGRFAGALGAMVSAGVPLIRALQGAAEAAGNREVARRVRQAAVRVNEGRPLHRALEAVTAINPETVQMIAYGEESGRLGQMAVRAAVLAQTEAERRIKILTQLLEPVLVIGFAAIVGFVAVAMLQAMYSLRPVSP